MAERGDRKIWDGERPNRWAMTVSGRWRICFEFKDGDAHNVEIADYHKG